MKRTGTALLAAAALHIILLAGNPATAQGLRIGTFARLGATSLRQAEHSLFAWELGGAACARIRPRWEGIAALSLKRAGERERMPFSQGWRNIYGKVVFSFRYLNLDAQVGFRPTSWIMVQGGLYAAGELACSKRVEWWTDRYDIEAVEGSYRQSIPGHFRTSDFGISAGLSVRTGAVSFEAIVRHGLTDLRREGMPGGPLRIKSLLLGMRVDILGAEE